ncbi:MAG: hypothetical protein ACK4IT_09040 [Thioalkalivibrionaceae bacterium]
MDRLPYHHRTAAGETRDFEFHLHPETGSAMRVHQLLSRLVEVVDHEVALLGETSNGDVLQALAMALAVRTDMVPAAESLKYQLARELVEAALESLGETARRAEGPVGHA